MKKDFFLDFLIIFFFCLFFFSIACRVFFFFASWKKNKEKKNFKFSSLIDLGFKLVRKALIFQCRLLQNKGDINVKSFSLPLCHPSNRLPCPTAFSPTTRFFSSFSISSSRNLPAWVQLSSYLFFCKTSPHPLLPP